MQCGLEAHRTLELRVAPPLCLSEGARHHRDGLRWQLEDGLALETVALQSAQHDFREHLLQPLRAVAALEQRLEGGGALPEDWVAKEAEQGLQVVRGVLQRRARQRPPVCGAQCAARLRDAGRAVADRVRLVQHHAPPPQPEERTLPAAAASRATATLRAAAAAPTSTAAAAAPAVAAALALGTHHRVRGEHEVKRRQLRCGARPRAAVVHADCHGAEGHTWVLGNAGRRELTRDQPHRSGRLARSWLRLD